VAIQAVLPAREEKNLPVELLKQTIKETGEKAAAGCKLFLIPFLPKYKMVSCFVKKTGNDGIRAPVNA
jgi:hypothetical protein